MVTKFRVSVGKAGAATYPFDNNFANNVATQVKHLEENYAAWVEHMKIQAGDILYGALQPTFEISQERVPYLTGALHDSGYLDVGQEGYKTVVHIGYAEDGDPEYAAFVHEDPIAYHKPPTSYKFLQGPLEEDSENIKRRIEQGFLFASGT